MLKVSYHIRECLGRCITLQRQSSRWGKDFAVAELMRMAVLEEPSEATVIALCRMLFVSETGQPLRPPSLGEPWFLGETEEARWPLEPIHLYQGIPFFIVRGWSLAGLAEQSSGYLAYCLLSGVWNESPFRMVDEEELAVLAHEFIQNGPWKRPLEPFERMFLLAQITPEVSAKDLAAQT